MKYKHLSSPFFLLLFFAIIFFQNSIYAQNFGLTGYNKVFWLKADEVQSTLPADGSNITTWLDRSGNSMNFVQDGTYGVPKLSHAGFNFQPSVLWDATSSNRRKLLWSNSTFTPSTSNSYYVFVVSRPYGSERAWAECIIKFYPSNNYSTNSNSSTGLFWTGQGSTGNDGSNINRRVITGYTASTNIHFTGSTDANGFNATDNRYGLISWICPNNSSPTSGVLNQIWLNGRMSPFWDGTTGSSDRIARGTSWLWHTTAQRIQLGQGGTNDYFPYSGDISEVLLLSRSGNDIMATSDLQKVQTYLAVKYGLMLNSQSGNWLNSTGQTIWNVSDAAYNNNVFGLGKDSGTSLNQKQSRAVDNTTLTVFLGDLATLNLQNTNTTLNDMQYVMFGHNGVNSHDFNCNIPYNTEYLNGKITSTTGLNIQSGAIYKAQLTNLTTITLNMQNGAFKGDLYQYAFVSTSDAFNQLSTKIYPIINGVVQVTIDTSYKYIRFAGHYAEGPGGVSQNLRLWLKADDPLMFTLESLSPSDSKLTSYTAPAGTTVVQGVAEWSDYIRSKTFSWYNKGTQSAYQQMPVHNPRSLKMNFHPAVTFYGSGATRSSYIRCNDGITSIAKPAKHTAIFLTNNDFSRNPWVYPMSFGAQIGSYNGPQYGVEKSGNNVVGRFRVSTGTVLNGNQPLFSIGSTSILSYYFSASNLTFRFNGLSETVSSTSSWGSFDMSSYSLISGGYDEDRTIIGDMAEVIIFEDELNASQINQLESYLAFKYGITLRPNAAPNRYHYRINNGLTSVWDGTQTSGKFVTFYNRVAAVVRDDASNLNNKESHSTEDGTLLHLGVAGTKLGGSNSQLGELENGEAIAFGHNNDFGFTSNQAEACGEFTHRFNTIWLVHKVTNNNRPVKMLVGAENNIANTMGANSPQTIKDYYNKLNSNYEIYLIVADSPADILSGNYKAVIPMYFINGECQCMYFFSNEDTYITFGYKQLTTGCVGELEFNGKKTFNWNQYGATNYGTQNVSVTKGAVSLGDGLSVTSSTVVYGAGVRTLANYPRRNGQVLTVMRRDGAPGSAVTTTINFNAPVEADFNISGLDYYSRGFEEVTIIGYCNGTAVIPKLTYAGNKNQATYTINANTATVTKQQVAGNGNRIGMVNITFDQAISQIVIQYKIIGTVNSSLRNIYISPISLRPVPPPPPINEDGLSFTKYSTRDSISTCETVNYIFEVSNTNCDDKIINFQDILNPNLRWATGSLVLDSLNETRSGSITTSNYGATTTLTMDNLLVQGQKKIRFSATAYVDENYQYPGWQKFGNSAKINYLQLIESTLTPRQLYSVDKYTLDSLSFFAAEYKERYDEASILVTTNKDSYSASEELTITYTIDNPNGDISDCFLFVDFNSNWQIIDNSFVGPSGTYFLYPDPTNSAYFFFAGSSDGLTGFTLHHGITKFSITMSAPPIADIPFETVNGETVREYFRIIHSLESFEDDPCITASLINTVGEKEVPFCNLDLQVIPTISNCNFVDLTQTLITAGSTFPAGTSLKYYRDLDQNGILGALDPELSNPEHVTVSGYYIIKATGCDTLTKIIIVTVKDSTSSLNTIHICSNELPFIWNDTTFTVGTTPGIYNYSYHTTNFAGCDSTANLSLTISQPYTITINDSICIGSTYNKNGFHVNTAGTYQQHLLSMDGCDSIVILNLTVNQLPTPTIINNNVTTQLTCSQTSISVTASGGSSYVWSGGLGNNASATIQNEGTYTVTVTNKSGCFATGNITITSDGNVPVLTITNNTGNDTLTCSRTTISLSVSATPPATYTYLWAGGETSASCPVASQGTYTVTVTNTANGCYSVESYVIYKNISPPNATISNNTGSINLTCSRTQINVSATGGVSYAWSGGLGSSASAAITSPGVYTVTVTEYNGCTATASININQNITSPSVSIVNNTGITQLTCNVTNISVTASGGTLYAWSGGTSLNTATTTFETPNTYKVTVTGYNGCTATENITITQNITPPTVYISSTEAQLNCSRTQIMLTASGGVSYAWSHNLLNNAIVFVSNPNIYSVTATGNNGCTNVATKEITQDITTPYVDIINNSNTSVLTCNQQTVSLTADGVGNVIWSHGLGTLANVNVNTPNTYSVTITGVNGCTNSKSITITENKTLPTATITNSTGNNVLTCNRTSITLQATGNGSYAWNDGISTGNTITVTESGTYSVTVTGSNGCSSSASIFIDKDMTPPIATITNNTATNVLTCTTTSISVTVPGGNDSYSWNGGISLNTSTNTFTTPNTYTVTVIGYNGCMATESITITQNITPPTPAITPSATEITCSVSSITLTASGAESGGTYLWNTGQTTPAIVVTTNNNYSVTVTNLNGCKAVASIQINKNNTPPIAGIINNSGSNTLTCSLPNISLTATGGGTYLWSTGATSSSLTAGNPGTYTVTVTSPNGCSANTSITVYEDKTLPAPAITSSATELTCSLTNITLTATGGVSYSWNTGQSTASINVTTPGTYSVTVTSANGCTETTSRQITQNNTAPSPNINSSPNSNTLTCSLPSILLTASGGGSYLWNTGATSSSLTAGNSGTYTVTVTSPNGCSASTSIIIYEDKVLPTPVITPSATELTCSLVNITLTATGGVLYSWNTGQSTASINVSTSDNFRVTVTGANGCKASTSQIITKNTTPPAAGIINNNGSNILSCSLQNISLTATGSGTYLWSHSLGNSATVTVSSPNYYTVTVTDANGCSSSASINITSNSNVPAIMGTLWVCQQGTRNLSADIQNGTWSSSNTGIATVNSTSGIVSGISAGTTTIRYTVTATGCFSEVNMIVNPLPTPPSLASASKTSVCNGESTLLSYSGGDGTTFKWYSGSCGGTLAGSGNNLTVNPMSTTTYYGRWENSCGNSSCFQVIVSMAMPVNTQITASICKGESYTQNGFNESVAGSYSKHLTTVKGCDSIVTLVLSYYPDPVLYIHNPQPVCPSETIDLTSASITLGTPNLGSLSLTYWMDENCTNPITNPNAVNSSGTYYIKAISSNNCSKVFPVIVSFYTLPAIYGNTSLFVGETSLLTASAAYGTWSCTPSGVINISSTGIVTAHLPGVVTVTYTTSYGCSTSIIVTVNIAQCNDISIVQNLTFDAIHNGDVFIFPSEIEGYTSTTSTLFTVTNYRCIINNISVSLIGVNTDKFILNASNFGPSLPFMQSTSFTISPVLGLPEGIYESTVEIRTNVVPPAPSPDPLGGIIQGDDLPDGSGVYRFKIRFRVKNGCNCTD